jgi:hypothetical protein
MWTAQVRCQTAGTVGNGYEAGAINTIVVVSILLACASTVESDSGADGFLMTSSTKSPMSLDGFPRPGPMEATYITQSVFSEIADVVVNSPRRKKFGFTFLGT